MDVQESTLKQNDVALRLLKHVIASADKSSNLAFSPPSINFVLSMIAAGSVGTIKDQILSFLGSPSTDHLNALYSEIVSVVFADGSSRGGPKLSVANAVWIDESLSFKPSFKQLLEDSYKATANQVDFQRKADKAVAEVNSWAEKHTNGLIKEILSPESVNSLTRLIFANALYFKGAWLEPLNASLTKDDDFYLLDGNLVRVPFMTCKDEQRVRAYDGFKVMRLPYKQGKDRKRRFSMYFYLPNANDGLPTLVEKITSSSGFVENHIPNWLAEGKFRIPKFEITFGFEASDIVDSLGMTSLFCAGELTEIVDSPSAGNELSVSGLIHEAFIKVNEEGTEAAAVTATGMMGFSLEMPEIERIDFVADHPFLFLIREEVTGLVLMMGQVLNPE